METQFKKNSLSEVGTHKVEWFLTTGCSDIKNNVAIPESYVNFLIHKHDSKDFMSEIYVDDEFYWSPSGFVKPLSQALKDEANFLDEKMKEILEIQEKPIKDIFAEIELQFEKAIQWLNQKEEVMQEYRDVEKSILRKYTMQKLT